jgi:hypothetical protein
VTEFNNDTIRLDETFYTFESEEEEGWCFPFFLYSATFSCPVSF